MKHVPRLKKASILGLVSLLIAPQALAVDFNPNYLLSDAELEDAAALDLAGVQAVLDARGTLGALETDNHDGVEMSAAEIIIEAALDWTISPKFLIVLLQKEQSLIEDTSPSDSQLTWATGYAICDSCSKSDPTLQRWGGFGQQVYSAAATFRDGYLADIATRGETVSGYGPGITKEVDGIPVTPTNAATAALYTYTPHIHGNQLFVTLWDRYFTQIYPSGSLLRARGDDTVWLVRFGERRPITSNAALHSRFNVSNILDVDSTTLLQYEVGRDISFPNYALLQSPDGKIYLIVDEEKRWIDSWETFVGIGFSTDEIIEVEEEDLDGFEDGKDITLESVHPQGYLIQNNNSGGVYFIQEGKRHPIISREILDLNFKNWPIHPVDPEEIAQYFPGNAVQVPEGTLIKSVESPVVYVVSDGERRPIASGEVFEYMGWQWGNIVELDEIVVGMLPEGDEIDLDLTSEDTEDVEIATE